MDLKNFNFAPFYTISNEWALLTSGTQENYNTKDCMSDITSHVQGTEPSCQRTYKVEDIAAALGIGRTSAYNLVKEGHFKVVRIGTAIRISKKSFDEWLDKQNF